METDVVKNIENKESTKQQMENQEEVKENKEETQENKEEVKENTEKQQSKTKEEKKEELSEEEQNAKNREYFTSEVKKILPNILKEHAEKSLRKVVEDNLKQLEQEHGTDGMHKAIKAFDTVFDSEYASKELKQLLTDYALHTNPKFFAFVKNIAGLLEQEKSVSQAKSSTQKLSLADLI